MIAFLLFRLISGLWDDGNQRAVSYSLTDMLRSVDIFGYFSLGCSIGWWTSSAPFGRGSGAASRAAPGEAFPNVCFVTGFTCEVGPEAIGGLHRQGEAMKSWFHAAYTLI